MFASKHTNSVPVLLSMNKKELFKNLLEKIKSIVEGKGGKEEKLRRICQILKEEVLHYDWVGIYFANGERKELLLGPFAGEETEHVRIKFGQGICGQAAEKLHTFIVQDVSKETNYLACSPFVKSEIVVPIFKDGNFVAELDIDSHKLSPFSEEDKDFLEKVCEIISEII